MLKAILVIWVSALPATAAPIFVPRLGLLLSGSGEARLECSGNGCGDLRGTRSGPDVDDESGLGLGGLLLLGAPDLRYGLDLIYVPGTEVDPDGATNQDLGSDLTAMAVVEVGLGTDGFLRGGVGAVLLFPDDDLDDALDALEDRCADAIDQGVQCDVDRGPYVGFTLGLAGGLRIDLGSLTARLELALQYLSVPILRADLSAFGRTAEEETIYSGSRVWLALGVELGG